MSGALTCVIVLNWNRPHDTLECLESLLRLKGRKDVAILVCDNASSDNSVEIILDWAKRRFTVYRAGVAESEAANCVEHWDFALLVTECNFGYAVGNNAGIKFALSCDRFEYIWILNNDVVVDTDSLCALTSCATRNRRIAVWGSTIGDYHERNSVQCAGGCRYSPITTIMTPVFSGERMDEVLDAGQDAVELDYISGAAFFVRTDVIRSIGLFNELFFLYYEEIDYCQRLRKAGLDVAWCKRSIVWHKGGVSTGGRSGRNDQESRLSNYHENLSTLHYTWVHHKYLFPIAALLRFGGKATVYIAKRRWYLFPTLVKAYLKYFQVTTGRARKGKILYYLGKAL